MPQFSLKVHDSGDGTVVAACDSTLLGETVEEDGTVLHVKESFYDGDNTDITEIVDAMTGCMTTNFVGENLIAALQDAGIVSEDEVRYVDGVPHVQLFYI
jgi:hypothetical protein